MDGTIETITENDKEIIEYLRKHLKSTLVDFKKLYFFGSRAKGTYYYESDYDFVVIVDKRNYKKELKVADIIGKAEYLFDIFIDIHILTENEFRYNPFFYREVIKFGVLYE